MDKLYTVNETADYFKVTTVTIHNWINEGFLKAHKVGNNVRIKESEIQRLLEEGSVINNV